jgi:hypothetical protein
MKQEIYGLLDLNQKELVDLTTSTYKLVWEQVLLLAISARQQYFHRDTNEGFHQRVKMVHVLNKKYRGLNESEKNSSRDIFLHLYKMLESEYGSNKIIEYLLDDEKKNSIFSIKKEILADMEKRKIAFPSLQFSDNYNRHYSYYSLYQILKQPIELFRILLDIDNSIEDFINKMVGYVAREYIENNNSYCLKSIFRGIEARENDFNFIIQNIDSVKNKEELEKVIKGQIAVSMGVNFTFVYNKLSDPFFDESKGTKIKPLSNIFHITSKIDTLEFSINKDALSNIININQLDELTIKIKKELEKVNDGKEYSARLMGLDNKERIEQSEVLKILKDWYKKSNTDIFNKLEQIPKIIASILEFDIRYFKGFFDPDFGFYRSHLTPNQQDHKQLPANEIYTLVSLFIRNYLYYKDNRQYLYGYKEEINSYLIDDMKNRDFVGISHLNNQMMGDWTTFEKNDYKRMINRFKRLSPYLSVKSNENIDEQIKKQQNISKTENAPAYPLDSYFALPLWTNRLYIKEEEQDGEVAI